jgi:hypothetical protein
MASNTSPENTSSAAVDKDDLKIPVWFVSGYFKPRLTILLYS